MAESPDLDFRIDYSPAIQEVQCPSTPGLQLSIKSPDLSTSSSSEETEVARGDGTQSPPPNCAICLGRCRNKCFTDSCMHRFCFKCLLEWSKVKPECPLCKQTFKSIIHNVKSIGEFEEYLVQQPVPASPNPDAYPPFTIPAHLYQRLPSLYNGRVNLYMDDLAMNTLDLTGTSSSTSNTNHDMHRPTTYRRMMPGPAQLLDMYSQETIQGETGSGSLSQLWRRYVYDRKLYALPMPDITGRFRESSARYYRDYPAQIHRLMPWINRDIVCLLRNTEHDVSAVMEQINSMLMTCNILSPDFRRRLQTFLGTKTAHFIHELNNFARSPFDMIGYDRLVQYSSSSAEEIVIEFSSTSSAGSDVESVNNDILQEASTSRRSSQQPIIINANSGGGFNLYTTTTTSTSSQASAINLSTHNRGAGGEISEGTTTTSTVEVIRAPTSERPTNIVLLSSTSSDECQFILEQKPPHLRTPEMVSLNSNSDSDVVFLQETKSAPLQSKWAPIHSVRVRRAQRRRANPSVNTISYSTSNSDTDGYHYGSVSSPKKSKMDERGDTAAADATVKTSAISNSENDQLAKVKEEFNQGASTSTGLQSRYRSTRPNIAHSRRYKDDDTSDSDFLDDGSSSSTGSHFTGESISTSDSDTSWSKSRRSSNKQSLKRSRQQRASAASNRKTRRQLSASKKSRRSKRTKSSKTTSNKSSAYSSKKKKTGKRSRRKSTKSSKTERRKRQIVALKHEITTEEEEEEEEDPQQSEYLGEVREASTCTCTLSSHSTAQPHSEGEQPPRTPPEPELRSSTSSPLSNSITSDANDAAEDANSSAPLAAGDDSLNSVEPTLPPPQQITEHPNANLAIYSDTD